MKIILLIAVMFSFGACSTVKDAKRAKDSVKLETVLVEGAF